MSGNPIPALLSWARVPTVPSSGPAALCHHPAHLVRVEGVWVRVAAPCCLRRPVLRAVLSQGLAGPGMGLRTAGVALRLHLGTAYQVAAPSGRCSRSRARSDLRTKAVHKVCLVCSCYSFPAGWAKKRQRVLEADRESPRGRAQTPSPGEPCLGPPATLGPRRSIYFSSPKSHSAQLGSDFFDQPAVALARAFLGQVLVRRLDDGTELRGRIVETEAYLGPEDEAAHSRGGRQTPRNRGMFMKPGTLYVYIIYGMYFCLNVSSQGDGACVLLRALEPLGGLETMRQLRSTLRKGTTGRALKDRELCSGPSKLCQALAIDKSFDQRDLAKDRAVWLERSPPGPSEPAVVAAARVGIGHAGEWAQKPLRFYLRGSPWVSVVDRAAEQNAQA